MINNERLIAFRQAFESGLHGLSTIERSEYLDKIRTENAVTIPRRGIGMVGGGNEAEVALNVFL